jgi:cytidylate kinase
MQIAIDGPVSSGKSTISKLVAKKLGLIYIDTGAMYRTVAFHCLREGVDLNNEEAVCQRVKKNRLHFELLPVGDKNDGRNCTILLNGEDVSWEIREQDVTLGSSVIGRYGCVREYLVEKQQKIAIGKDVIMEGRDITYRVLPNAEIKIYLTATEMVRALRRQIHLLEHGKNGGLAKIRDEIRARDKQDMNRTLDPLKKIPEAVKIDTSDMTIEEVVEKIVKLAKEKIKNE